MLNPNTNRKPNPNFSPNPNRSLTTGVESRGVTHYGGHSSGMTPADVKQAIVKARFFGIRFISMRRSENSI